MEIDMPIIVKIVIIIVIDHTIEIYPPTIGTTAPHTGDHSEVAFLGEGIGGRPHRSEGLLSVCESSLTSMLFYWSHKY